MITALQRGAANKYIALKLAIRQSIWQIAHAFQGSELIHLSSVVCGALRIHSPRRWCLQLEPICNFRTRDGINVHQEMCEMLSFNLPHPYSLSLSLPCLRTLRREQSPAEPCALQWLRALGIGFCGFTAGFRLSAPFNNLLMPYFVGRAVSRFDRLLQCWTDSSFVMFIFCDLNAWSMEARNARHSEFIPPLLDRMKLI